MGYEIAHCATFPSVIGLLTSPFTSLSCVQRKKSKMLSLKERINISNLIPRSSDEHARPGQAMGGQRATQEQTWNN